MKKIKQLNISWRILCGFAIVCLVLSMCPAVALAIDKAGENIEWTLDGGILTVTGTGKMNNFTEHNRAPWYKQKDKIRAVIVEEGITSIGDLAFYQFDCLVSVTLASSVKEIGAYAFSDCTDLELVNLGSVEYIGRSAFARCQRLTSIRIPSSVKTIDDKAFYRCSSLTSVYIPESVTTLGNMIFTYCENLIGVSMQASVTTIPEWMFYSCSNLTEVILSSNIKTADDRAFYGCESFASVYYPSEEKEALVESIKSTSIPSFSHISVINDTPADNKLNGAQSTFEDNILSFTDITVTENEDSIITTKVSETSKLENSALTDTKTSAEIIAFIGGPDGWSELAERIKAVMNGQQSNNNTLSVTVTLAQDNSVPPEVLKPLVGEDVQINVLLANGSAFGIDCNLLDEDNAEVGNDLNCVVKENAGLSVEYEDQLSGAQTYEVKYNDVEQSFSSSIFVGKGNALSIATIYRINKNGELVKLQSVVIDKHGNATFYLQSVTSDTELVLGVGVKGETAENAIIPDSVAKDQYGLLDRYRPIEYAVVDEREFLGMNSGQFALAVFGVIAAIVIVVSIIAVIIYRKKRLELLHKLKSS